MEIITMNDLYKNYNQSVINTDNYERRRFNKIYNMSGAMRDLNVFDKPFPTFEPLLGDIWSSLYKMSPEMKDDTQIDDELKTNHSLIDSMLKDEDFNKYHEYTKLDELSSAIGTVKFGEKTKDWLEEKRQENDDLNEKSQDIQAKQRQLEKQENENGEVNEQLEKDLNQAMSELQDSVSQELENSDSFSDKLSEAFSEKEQTKEEVKSLLGGTKAGSDEAELKKTPLRDKLNLADQLIHNDYLKEISEWAGRFKQIAKNKQKSKHTDSMERKGVTIGSDIEMMLPSELALYKHNSTKQDFLRRFAEGQVMQYDNEDKEKLGKGQVIICLDQSGSMTGLDEQSKGFVLALMGIAKKQKRDFCFIPFSTSSEIYRFSKGKITTAEMVEICQNFLGGGTDFYSPLSESLQVIKESKFKQSDIVFVTDGVANLDDQFLHEFNHTKQEKDFSVLSLVIGNSGDATVPKSFSDNVKLVEDFTDESS